MIKDIDLIGSLNGQISNPHELCAEIGLLGIPKCKLIMKIMYRLLHLQIYLPFVKGAAMSDKSKLKLTMTMTLTSISPILKTILQTAIVTIDVVICDLIV